MVSSVFHHLVPAQDPCFISQNILSTIPHTLYTPTTLQKRLPVLVLPNIKMNPPQVYMCSPSCSYVKFKNKIKLKKKKSLPVGSSCEHWAQYYCPRRLLPPPAAEGSGSHHAVTGRAVSGHTSPWAPPLP